MAVSVPVVIPRTPKYERVSDHELRIGREHAQREYGRDPDQDLLRVCANTTLERWSASRKIKLPFLAATVVRELVPARDSDRVEKIEALKGAVMKIMSARSAIKRGNNARKRKAGISVPPAPKQTEHPDDEIRKKGQLLLL